MTKLSKTKIKQGKANYLFGIKAEKIVKFWLIFKGYKILESRYRNFAGEIDLIAVKNGRIIFFEIKSTSKKFQPDKYESYDILTKNQINRIRNSAQIYLAKNEKFAGYDQQIDLVVYWPFANFKHLENVEI